eukprot:scaffold17473_cov114-Isochrysis_galbana.AAC.1
MRWLCNASEKRSSASSSSVARGDSLAWCALRDGGGSPLPMARSCFVRASCASASARSAMATLHMPSSLTLTFKTPKEIPTSA